MENEYVILAIKSFWSFSLVFWRKISEKFEKQHNSIIRQLCFRRLALLLGVFHVGPLAMLSVRISEFFHRQKQSEVIDKNCLFIGQVELFSRFQVS